MDEGRLELGLRLVAGAVGLLGLIESDDGALAGENNRFDSDGGGFTNGHGRTLSSGVERYCRDCGCGIEVPVLPVTVGAPCPLPVGTTVAGVADGNRTGGGW